MPIFSRSSAFARVTSLASQRPVHAAFTWLHNNPKTLMDLQTELVVIPAPPFGEQERSKWAAEKFKEIGLENVQVDAIGNVIAFVPAPHLPPESTGHVVVLSAHIDTVFPAGTPLIPTLTREDGACRLAAPGACDNAAGVIGMLALAEALLQAKVCLPVPVVILANVGEEGEGDLRGVRYFYERRELAGRVAAHVVLDGAGADSAVSQALGSRRFQVSIKGPGGHSFTDSGTPNPIVALGTAIAALARTPVPERPTTTLNVGTVQGGTSVNSVPESATASIDFRSTSSDELLRLEVALHRAVEDAVEQTNAAAKNAGPRNRGALTFTIEKIGDRPAGALAADSPVLEALRAVDRHLGIQTDLRLGSTDANIPISLGVPALSVGAGGDGGGAHTVAEWYSDKNREIGLRRILLLILALAEWAAEQ
ncbi:M20/M25/M40 family metallo-hydrolase [Occallatibacter savannae]|uniref:M20/M25/M40 family metallo-hydrolase n=1 Tax=Occallatibacter savannae TaxID=1002691 RepID=UPI000D6A0108|nr:M20/M25/M40 family metallo-hydrolase [Occallatibacter savannae]